MPTPTPRDETAFLDRYRPDDFDRPSVAVDVALLTVTDDALQVLMVRRKEHPHKGRWALPGGFVAIDESLETAAHRVLREKTGLRGVFVEQLYTFGEVRRDPRMRIISVAYYALVPASRLSTVASPTRRLAQVSVTGPEATVGLRIDGRPARAAFDHAGIVATAVVRMRGKLDYAPIGFELLADEFTLLDLQRIHEAVLERPVNKDSFRRRMLAAGDIVATGARQEDVGHRPAALFRRDTKEAAR